MIALILLITIIPFVIIIDNRANNKPLIYRNDNNDVIKEYVYYNSILEEDIKVRVNLTHTGRVVSKFKEQQYNN